MTSGSPFYGNRNLATSLTHTDLRCQNLGSTGLIREFLAQAHDATKEVAWLPLMGTRSCSQGGLHESCRGCQADGSFGFSPDKGPYYLRCPRTDHGVDNLPSMVREMFLPGLFRTSDVDCTQARRPGSFCWLSATCIPVIA